MVRSGCDKIGTEWPLELDIMLEGGAGTGFTQLDLQSHFGPLCPQYPNPAPDLPLILFFVVFEIFQY